MTKQREKITNLEILQSRIQEVESESKVQLINIRLKSEHLKKNFFLKTDTEMYQFDRGQRVEPELLKLAIRKILKPSSSLGGTLKTLVSTFVVQMYGKKLSKKMRKLLKYLVP